MKINNLYAAYRAADAQFQADPSTTNTRHFNLAKDDLFRDVIDYARRSIGKINRSEQWKSLCTMEDDLAQATALKVWVSLPNFKGQCKFSTCAFDIARCVALDAMKMISRRREISFLEWKAYDADLETHGNKNGDRWGAAPGSDRFEGKYKPDSYIVNAPIANSDDHGEDSDADRGCGKQPMLSQFYVHRDENFITGEIDLGWLLDRIHGYDNCVFVMLVILKNTAVEVAKELEWYTMEAKPDARKVQNRYAKVLKAIKDMQGPVSDGL